LTDSGIDYAAATIDDGVVEDSRPPMHGFLRGEGL
jgi:hypothetical protein